MIIIGFNNGLLNSLFNSVNSNFSNFQIKNSLKIRFLLLNYDFLFDDFNKKANFFKLVLI